MGRGQPNAPELQEILLQSPDGARQPPQNPQFYNNYNTPPPPYSDMASSAPIYPQNATSNFQAQPPIHSQSPPLAARPSHVMSGLPRFMYSANIDPVFADFEQRKFRKKVRRFNMDLFFASLASIGALTFSLSLYGKRNCSDYVITQIGDTYITLSNLVQMHFNMITLGALLLLVSLLKCCSCGKSRSPFYRFIVTVLSFFGLCSAGLMAYLAFYSTCSGSLKEALSNSLDTIYAAFNIRLAPPKDRIVSKSNVFDVSMEADPGGRVIFLIQLFNVFLYLSNFLQVTTIG